MLKDIQRTGKKDTRSGFGDGIVAAARKNKDVVALTADAESFVIGKAQQFSEGTDVSIFACGHMVWKAIQAGVALEEKGVSVEIINIHTIKPLDTEAVLASIRKTGCAVTAEEHNSIGGLGDEIARVAARNFPIPIEYVGTKDTFGESGKPEELLKKYGLDASDIVAAAEKVMKRKTAD